MLKKLKGILENLKHHEKIINWHWENDRDLILILRGVRFCYLLSLLFLLNFIYDLHQIEFDMLTLNSFVFDARSLGVGTGFLVFAQVVKMVTEVHIAFFRNFPGKPKE